MTMIANSTEVKNNFGKYLKMIFKEDVIITSNGNKVARLTLYEEDYKKDDSFSIVRDGSVAFDMPPRKVSYEEFLEISEESQQRLEYIDGEIYLLASPKIEHQVILGDLYIIFHNWFKGKKCKPMFAPFDIKLKRKNGGRNVVQPDLMVICDLEEFKNEKGKYDGVPVMVLEITSESTRRNDYVKKLDIYLSTGVKEYWIVNPIIKEVQIFHFSDNEILENLTFKGNDIVKSFLFDGFTIPIESIFS
jgi:Uma2 family endonuclease